MALEIISVTEGPAPTFTFEGQSYGQLAKALEIQLSRCAWCQRTLSWPFADR